MNDWRSPISSPKSIPSGSPTLVASARRAGVHVFGNEPPPAVRIQIEQLRGRLETFAGKHAAEVANGWRIVEVEQAIDEDGGQLDVDGEPFRITGRIDRIDVNDRTGSWRLLDYKTGDTAERSRQDASQKTGNGSTCNFRSTGISLNSVEAPTTPALDTC